MSIQLPQVRGAIAISGICDLEPIRLNYLNEKLGLDMAEAERNSPVRHLPATAGELVMAYGTPLDRKSPIQVVCEPDSRDYGWEINAGDRLNATFGEESDDRPRNGFAPVLAERVGRARR